MPTCNHICQCNLEVTWPWCTHGHEENCFDRKATSNKRWGCPNSAREPRCWSFSPVFPGFSPSFVDSISTVLALLKSISLLVLFQFVATPLSIPLCWIPFGARKRSTIPRCSMRLLWMRRTYKYRQLLGRESADRGLKATTSPLFWCDVLVPRKGFRIGLTPFKQPGPVAALDLIQIWADNPVSD